MKITTIQNLIWLLLLICYVAYKYLPGMQTWNTTYAIQVGIIAVLTAILPYYATRFMASRMTGAPAVTSILVLPSLLAIMGYGVFYFVFIRANFPDVTAMQVMPRGLLPGLTISALLGTFRFLPAANTQGRSVTT
jgi:hypothetical protein